MSSLMRYAALVLVCVLVAGLSWGLRSRLQQQREFTQQLARLPVFTARALDGRILSAPAQALGPVVLIYFEPDCDHCQRQAVEMRQHADEFRAVSVLWLSKDSLAALQTFAHQYGLFQQSTMRVCQIRQEAATALGFFSSPDIRVYDADKKLRHRYKGETSALAIIHKLHLN